MSERKVERRLAADVAGYLRLVGSRGGGRTRMISANRRAAILPRDAQWTAPVRMQTGAIEMDFA